MRTLVLPALVGLAVLIATASQATSPKTGAEHRIMEGFPPPESRRVTQTTWDAPPFNRWAFQHISEVLPVAVIHRGSRPATPFDKDIRDLDAVTFEAADGRERTIPWMLAGTYTDAFCVLLRGRLITEQYFNDMRAETPHLIGSITNSIVGTLAGNYVKVGAIDPLGPITRYAPELAAGGYRGATVNDLLNMTTGVDFTMEYNNPTSGVSRLHMALGWKPRQSDVPGSTYEFLSHIAGQTDHGQKFTFRSSDAAALGWILERAASKPLPTLLSEQIWAKLGAEHPAYITVDAAGAAAACGGMAATLRDLARFAQMHMQDGEFQGRRIIPAKWIHRCRTGDPEKFGPAEYERFPNGAYSTQWWVRNDAPGVYMAIGEFGQLVFIDATTDFVAVKLSSWPERDNPRYHADTLAAIKAIRAEITKP